MDKVNLVHLHIKYYSAIKNKDILNSADKSMDLDSEWDNQDSKGHAWFVLTYKWILAV